MLGLCCNKIYGAMTNHDNGDDDVDNVRNEDVNDNNAASRSIYDGLTFNVIATPWS